MRQAIHHIGGSLSFDGAPITLADADWLSSVLVEETISAKNAGRDATDVGTAARMSIEAVEACASWRRCAGWPNPHDVDRVSA